MIYPGDGNILAVAREIFSNRHIYRATKFVTPNYVIKATRRHKHNGRDTRWEVVLTIGAPNYLEQKFIKLAQKAGEPFPIKKVELKFK